MLVRMQSPPTSTLPRYRLSYRIMVIQAIIGFISPRMIGLIDARTNNPSNNQYSPSFTARPLPLSSSFEDVLGRGHSHNDYHQKDPLRSALMHGLRSVEVDVFPIHGELFVAHTRLELDEKKTINNMYIDPILDVLKVKTKSIRHQFSHQPFSTAPTKQNYVKKTKLGENRQKYKKQKGQHKVTSHNTKERDNNLIDPSDDSLILLVDFKADPNISAKLLNRAIEPLKPYLSKVKNGKFYKGKLTVIVSGNRPKEESLFDQVDYTMSYDNIVSKALLNEKSSSFGLKEVDEHVTTRPFGFANVMLRQTRHNNQPNKTEKPSNKANNERFLFLDGRPNDLYQQKSTSMYPLISLNWSTVQLYHLLGKGDEFMKRCADLAHSQGKRIRVWGAPNVEPVWRRIMRNNIDWLSIDDHDRFAKFASKSR